MGGRVARLASRDNSFLPPVMTFSLPFACLTAWSRLDRLALLCRQWTPLAVPPTRWARRFPLAEPLRPPGGRGRRLFFRRRMTPGRSCLVRQRQRCGWGAGRAPTRCRPSGDFAAAALLCLGRCRASSLATERRIKRLAGYGSSRRARSEDPRPAGGAGGQRQQ